MWSAQSLHSCLLWRSEVMSEYQLLPLPSDSRRPARQMLKGREGRPSGSEGSRSGNRRPMGEGTVGGQEQWDLWHCGVGREG